MKKVLVVMFGFFLSHGAFASWSCNIQCQVVSVTEFPVSGISTTYEDARSSMRNQCQGEGYQLRENSCGKTSDSIWECRGQCRLFTSETHYLSGSGANQWAATEDAIKSCRELVQQLSPGMDARYAVGPCGGG